MLLSITMRCGTVTAANQASSLGLGNHSLTGAFTTNVEFTSRVTVVSGPPNTMLRVTTMLCNTVRHLQSQKGKPAEWAGQGSCVVGVGLGVNFQNHPENVEPDSAVERHIGGCPHLPQEPQPEPTIVSSS